MGRTLIDLDPLNDCVVRISRKLKFEAPQLLRGSEWRIQSYTQCALHLFSVSLFDVEFSSISSLCRSECRVYVKYIIYDTMMILSRLRLLNKRASKGLNEYLFCLSHLID